MIVDFHTHTFPDSIAAQTIEKMAGSAHLRHFSDGTGTMLTASMRRAGVGLSVTLPVATAVRQVEHINTYAAGENEKTGETGRLAFGCMHPDYENYRQELRRISSLGIKGIKVHPVYQKTALDDVRYLRIFDEAASLGLIVVTHTGFDVGFPDIFNCTPQMTLHVLEEIGSFPFVAAHMGGIGAWEEAARMLAGTGIWLDTAFSLGRLDTMGDGYWEEEKQHLLTAEDFAAKVRLFGADHILFGTDSPWRDQAAGIRDILALPLADREKDLILGGNALRLLGM